MKNQTLFTLTQTEASISYNASSIMDRGLKVDLIYDLQNSNCNTELPD